MESAKALKDLLKEYGIAPESTAARQMADYFALLQKWNWRINLTSGTDWPIVGPLFQESVWASSFYPDEANALLDVGSGAGFPAVPMRILLPHIHLDMVESRARKAAFLETVVSELKMEGTLVHQARLSDHLRMSGRIWDCITWKGLKLGRSDLLQLRAHAHSKTQFWMFHGKEAAVEDPEVIDSMLKLIRSEKCPGRKDWMLSVYLLR